MWKSINIGLVAAVVAGSTAVTGEPIDSKAHPPGVGRTAKSVAGRDPAVRYAQATREQRSTSSSQIFYNIVADGGAACNGDVVTVTRSISIGRGARVLSIPADTFSSGDVGKAIVVPGAGNGGGKLFARIVSFTNAQNVMLDRGAATGLSAASKEVSYGTDDAPKFMAFNRWARDNQAGKQVVLTVPKGANCWFGSFVWSTSVNLNNAWAAGISNLIVEGAGATINSVGGAAFWLGGRGVCQAGIAAASGCSARIETAQAGAKQITLTPSSLTAGYVSRFPVGKWVMLGGLDTQGLWKAAYGFPPNQTFFEWRQVAAVDPATGVLTLDRPLSNTYLSSWPNYNQGSNYEADSGGPATIWAVSDSWNSTIEYRGLTINQEGQTYSPARNVTYREVRFGGGHGGIPTQNETWSAINSSFADVNMETDKLIGTMTMDGVTIKQIVFQSSSIDLFIMKRSSVTNRLDGGAKRTEITDSTLNVFGPGVWAYGNSLGSTICTRCNIPKFNFDFGVFQNDNPSPYSMSEGVISFANTSAKGSGPAQRWVVPGAYTFWSAPGYLTIGLFQIKAISQDDTSVHIQTNEKGGFPSIGRLSQFRTHPAPQFTCDACTGDPAIVATNIQSGAIPLAPLGTFSKRTFTPSSAQGNLGDLSARGKLVNLTINVSQAYTGVGPAILRPTGQFHMFTIKQSDWTQFDWWPAIDLKTPGERIITPAGVSCNGAPGGCGADSNLAVPEAVWIQDKLVPHMASALRDGSAPKFTISIRTDQGVVK